MNTTSNILFSHKNFTLMSLKFKFLFLVLLGVSSTIYSQEGTVSVTQDPKIETLLEYKKSVKPLDIYKIQIFQGERSDAEDAKREFLFKFGEWPVVMEYNTPNYKIWVGNFTTRLEADRALMRIKKTYPIAFIFQPKEDDEKR